MIEHPREQGRTNQDHPWTNSKHPLGHPRSITFQEAKKPNLLAPPEDNHCCKAIAPFSSSGRNSTVSGLTRSFKRIRARPRLSTAGRFASDDLGRSVSGSNGQNSSSSFPHPVDSELAFSRVFAHRQRGIGGLVRPTMADTMRASSLIPQIKCSTCHVEIAISAMGEHVCAKGSSISGLSTDDEIADA